MKLFHQLTLWLIAALALQSRADTTTTIKISGTVVDGKGSPVAGAGVDYYHFPAPRAVGLPDLEAKQHAITDDKGAFAFSVSDGAATVVVKKAGLGSGWQTWQAV